MRSELWEPPAGLLDIAGEVPVVAAARELAEEADLVAAQWSVLVEFYTSPGGSSEKIVVFLARGLTAVPGADLFTRTDEEAGMVPVWVPLDEALAAVLAGRLHSPTAAMGILAAVAARASSWTTLRPVTVTP